MLILRNSLVLIGLTFSIVLHAAEVRVICDDEDYHFKPIFAQFEKETKIKVNAAYVEEGELAIRVLAAPTDFDLIITQDMSVLAQLKQKGITTALAASKIVEKVPEYLKDKELHYVGLAYRPRAIIYSNERIKPETLTGYSDLASYKFKGRVCARSLDHTYNITLLSAIIVEEGEKNARIFAEKLGENLAMKSEGNDRKQALFISQNRCDIAPFNTYYYNLMRLEQADLKDAAVKTRIFFPDQDSKGAYVLVTGASLSKNLKNPKEASLLIDYVLSDYGQRFMAEKNYEYPVLWQGAYPANFDVLGENQKGIKNGQAKLHWVDVAKMAAAREEAERILTQVKTKTGK